jgi:hypothetical protein
MALRLKDIDFAQQITVRDPKGSAIGRRRCSTQSWRSLQTLDRKYRNAATRGSAVTPSAARLQRNYSSADTTSEPGKNCSVTSTF